MSSIAIVDETEESVESSSSAINWAPVIAGAFAAASLTFVLMLLGSGLGLMMVSPWTAASASATTVAASTAIWLVVVQWLSSGFGGYLAGRLRTKWVGVHTHETFFRDTAHGFLAWALATLLVMFVVSSTISSVVGSGLQASSTILGGAAMGASSAAAGKPEMTSYYVDALFRPSDPAKLPAGAEADAAAASQVSHILLASVAGPVSDADKKYLVALVAARAGLSPADAATRVDAVLAQVEAAKTKAKEAADAARKAGAAAALLGALALLIGAFIAGVAAAFGGHQRDEDEARLFAVR